jgi:hypothetical protein
MARPTLHPSYSERIHYKNILFHYKLTIGAEIPVHYKRDEVYYHYYDY